MNKRLVSIAAFIFVSLGALADPAPDFTKLVKQTKDAVVSIEVESRVSSPSYDGTMPPGMPDIFEHFFGIPSPHFNHPFGNQQPRERIRQGQGSGFIIDTDGYLLTNAHVVEDADKVTVVLNTQREYEAEVIGSDKTTDIALLKIKAKNLPAATLGNSDDVEVGDWVLAMGSPFGFDYTATQGIVSATARSLPSGAYVPFIQTDAAINPGNSGGPLFNSQGEVIAINSQIYSRSGAFNGLAFSIPINVAKNIADQLKAGGDIQRGWLGVGIQNVDQQLAESFDMKKPRGALVSQVVSDSPADKAGIQLGDIILSFDGKSIDKSSSLPPIVAITPVGKDVDLIVLRQGKEKSLSVTIGDLNHSATALSSASNHWGMRLQNIEDKDRQALSYKNDGGVLIAETAPDSPAENSGIQAGDILLAIGGNPINNIEEAAALLQQASNKRPLPVLIHRNGNNVFLALVP